MTDPLISKPKNHQPTGEQQGIDNPFRNVENVGAQPTGEPTPQPNSVNTKHANTPVEPKKDESLQATLTISKGAALVIPSDEKGEELRKRRTRSYTGADVKAGHATASPQVTEYLNSFLTSDNPIGAAVTAMRVVLQPHQLEAFDFLTNTDPEDKKVKIMLMSRQQGKSFVIRVVMVLAALFPPKPYKGSADREVVICSQTKEKAFILRDKAQLLIANFMTDKDQDDVSHSFSGERYDNTLTVPNCHGGITRILFHGYPSDTRSGSPLRGYSPHLTIVDEGQSVDLKVINAVLEGYIHAPTTQGRSPLGIYYPCNLIVGTAPTDPEKIQEMSDQWSLSERDTKNSRTAFRRWSFVECQNIMRDHITLLKSTKDVDDDTREEIDSLERLIKTRQESYNDMKVKDPGTAESEFDCSFRSGSRENPLREFLDSYYAALKNTREAFEEVLEFDPLLPVFYSVDIGIVVTAVWFFQLKTWKVKSVNSLSGKVDFADQRGYVFLSYDEVSQSNVTGLGHMLFEKQREFGWIYGGGHLPHDVTRRVYTLGTDMILADSLAEVGVLGWSNESTADKDKFIRIADVLPRSLFNHESCETGLRHFARVSVNRRTGKMKESAFCHCVDAMSLIPNTNKGLWRRELPFDSQMGILNSRELLQEDMFSYEVRRKVNFLERLATEQKRSVVASYACKSQSNVRETQRWEVKYLRPRPPSGLAL